MSSKISLCHYNTGHLGLRIETKLVLCSIVIVVLLGFTQVPNSIQYAYAGAVVKSCEDVEHWNKIIFFGNTIDHWTADNEPDINPFIFHEIVVQVDPAKAPRVNKFISDKLNEIGYINASNNDTPEPEDFFFSDVTYSSFCVDGKDFMQVVGGMLLQPDSATLVIAYGIANAIWIVPSIAGIGIAVYLVKRKIE